MYYLGGGYGKENSMKKSEYLRIFKAFSDERRMRVLELLLDGEQCACILLEDLDISQPTLSHHMKILCDSGIVKGRPVGKWIYYSINEDGCERAKELLSKLTERKTPRSESLFGRLLGEISFPLRRLALVFFMFNVSKFLNALDDNSKSMREKDACRECGLIKI
jgi:ArsR family transcriptional regulator